MLENRQMWIIDDSDRYRAMKQNEIKNYIDILLELIKIFDNQNEEHVEKFLSRDNDYGRLEQCKVLPVVSETDRNTQLNELLQTVWMITSSILESYLKIPTRL